MSGPVHWTVWAAAAAAVTILLSLAAGAPVGPAGSLAAMLAPSSDYASFSGPSAQILFGSPLPQVEIQPNANSSEAATLALSYLLELAPNATDPAHPVVVAFAAPETLQRFNGTVSPERSNVNLIANLPVFPARGGLWSNGTAEAALTNTYQLSILDVNYSVTTGPGGTPGVQVSWSVSGWPWVHASGDELALEFVVNVVSGTGFETCTGAATTSSPATACASTTLPAHDAVWGSALSALKGSGPSGLTAWVSWSSQEGGSGAPSTPVTAGAYLESPTTTALVVAALTDGESAVSGSTLFLLAPGSVAHAVAAVAGDLPVFAGAAIVSGAAAGIGIVAARRRDRAIARDLSA